MIWIIIYVLRVYTQKKRKEKKLMKMITWLKECRCWEVRHEDGGDVGGVRCYSWWLSMILSSVATKKTSCCWWSYWGKLLSHVYDLLVSGCWVSREEDGDVSRVITVFSFFFFQWCLSRWRWLLVKEMHGCWCKRLVLVKARVAGKWFSDEEEIWEG